MARGTITPVALSQTAGTVATAATITAADGGVIAMGSNKSRNVVLHINNTAASTGTVNITVGDEPPAFRAGLGSVAVTVAGSTSAFMALEGARHVQSDGNINIDLGTSVSILFSAYVLPE